MNLSIIIPTYNEEASINDVVRDLYAALKEMGPDFEIIAVDDGSTDATAKILDELKEDMPQLVIMTHPSNRGFGKAVMTGVQAASKEKLLLAPADGQFDVKEIGRFASALSKHDMVLGTRKSWGGYTLWRNLQSLVYIKMVSMLFGQSYPDVNWVQGWRRGIFDVIKPCSKGVFFLQEMVARCGRAGLSIGRVESNQLPRKSGKAHGGRVGTILLTIWEMIRFLLTKHCGRLTQC